MTDPAALEAVREVKERDGIGFPTPRDVPADIGFALKFWQAFASQAHADRATLLRAYEEVVRAKEYKTLFDRVMDTWGAHMNADEALCDEMCRVLGADPDNVDSWPFDDTGWDWHDMSVELYGVTPGLLVSPEQLDRFWLTGFDTLYVNYSDRTGRSYNKRRGYEPSELRQGQRLAPTENERAIRHLRAQQLTPLAEAVIAAAEELIRQEENVGDEHWDERVRDAKNQLTDAVRALRDARGEK